MEREVVNNVTEAEADHTVGGTVKSVVALGTAPLAAALVNLNKANPKRRVKPKTHRTIQWT